MLCSRSASLITRTRMSRLIAMIILRMVSDLAESPYLTLSSLVQPSTSSAISSPKSWVSCGERVVGVLDGVVQQRGAQRRLGHAELGQDRGDGQRVGDVGVAALARSGRWCGSRRPGRPARSACRSALGWLARMIRNSGSRAGVCGRVVPSRAIRCRIRTRGCSACRCGPAVGDFGGAIGGAPRRGDGAAGPSAADIASGSAGRTAAPGSDQPPLEFLTSAGRPF